MTLTELKQIVAGEFFTAEAYAGFFCIGFLIGLVIAW